MGNQCTELNTFLMLFLLDLISKWIDQRKQFQIFSRMEASIF